MTGQARQMATCGHCGLSGLAYTQVRYCGPGVWLHQECRRKAGNDTHGWLHAGADRVADGAEVDVFIAYDNRMVVDLSDATQERIVKAVREDVGEVDGLPGGVEPDTAAARWVQTLIENALEEMA